LRLVQVEVIFSKKVSEKQEPRSSALPGTKWRVGLGEEARIRK